MDERIESYFNQELTPTEREKFESELLHNTQLAEEVAFYLSTRQLIREQVLAERHAEWQKLATSQQLEPAKESNTARQRAIPSWRSTSDPNPVLVLTPQNWYYATAAMLILAMGLAWFWFSASSLNAREMANAYVETNLYPLNSTMGSNTDSLQQAKEYYRNEEYAMAGTFVRDILQRNPESAELMELMGIIELRQQHYDQAIAYFNQLSGQSLRVNPGTFYEALAYILRGQPSDMEKARALLQTVISEDLEGKEEAEKIVRAMEETDPRPDP